MARIANSHPARPYEWRYASGPILRQAASAFQDIQFDRVHVFRLYMTPSAMPYLGGQKRGAVSYLDLDDVESIARLPGYPRDNQDTRLKAVEWVFALLPTDYGMG